MATIRWVGKAKTTAQVVTVTPGGTIASETFTLTIGAKTVSVTATGVEDAEDIATSLVTAWNASTEPEFEEITAADTTGDLTLTADTAGRAFAVTADATGSATLGTSTTTANSGPNDLNVAANYDTGNLPVNGDDLIFEDGDVDVLWNLGALSAVTLASLRRKKTYTGTIGLPDTNEDGDYPEYRETHLTIGSTLVFDEQGPSPSTRQTRLDVGSAQTTMRVIGEAGAADEGEEATEVLGTHASNAVTVNNGSLALAPKYGDASTFATVAANGGSVRIGEGCTITTIDVRGTTLNCYSTATTLNLRGDSQASFGTAAALTNANIYGGRLDWRSSGSPGTVEVFADGVVSFEEATDGVSVTKGVLHPGASWLDPGARVARPYDLEIPSGDISDLAELVLGRDVEIQVEDVA